MKNFLKIKSHLTEVAYYLEDIAVADETKEKIYQQITELERKIERVTRAIVSDKFIIDDSKFSFMGIMRKMINLFILI